MRRQDYSNGKVCSNCKALKPVDQFQKRIPFKDQPPRPAAWCKKCAQAENFLRTKTPEGRLRKLLAEHLCYMKRFAWVMDYLNGHPCVDCGETDLAVLEFDHLEPREISPLNISCSLAKIKEEILKCVVRCANCHTRITHQRRNDYRWRYINGESPKEIAQKSCLESESYMEAYRLYSPDGSKPPILEPNPVGMPVSKRKPVAS